MDGFRGGEQNGEKMERNKKKAHLSMFAVSLSNEKPQLHLSLFSLFTFCLESYKLTNTWKPKVNH